MLKSVIRTNNRQRYVVLDKLNEAVGPLNGKQVAVLGLAFKPNTDDMREAPSLTIIPELLKQGATVRAFDPIAAESAKRLLPAEVQYAGSVEEAVTGSDACLILTEWKEVTEMNLARVRLLLKRPVIVDGRNCFPLSVMSELGYEYHSIGRPPVGGEKRDRYSVNF
ncbi:hypothetical protein PACILC2_11040 [Paenibacillus cisolokensis]|uniref:UDP-glucose/GDP-mannose dehydrogenase C-terminal domain-containing protein n=1 Tax=Paenibacillus cisolokensis TaxID=1658519 RepID=A0ABQ4N3J8_9BACL|nr:hypothetical protein PACILC2_11040 [Paenibacillus cisolokensis]